MSTTFARVRLKNWKNFATVDVELQSRVFLVGPNASGKSNLLDVFRFLRDLASTGGGFQEAINRRGGVTAIRALAARKYPDVNVHVDLEATVDSPRWEYELAFSQDQQRRALVKKERVVRDDMVVMERPNADDAADPARLTQTYLEQVNVNREFREIAAFFASIRYLHLVPQLVREPDRSVGRANDPFGGDFLEQVANTQEKTRKARLRRIQEALAVAVPQLQEIELWRDGRGTPHVRGRYQHWRPQGAWQTEDQFSDGTLRLMGLLWAALEGGGPLLLEEPELSLHPEIVRYLPQMFARIQRRTGRQVIMSTHSPDLLRDQGIGLDEVLLLTPGQEGTTVEPAASEKEIKNLLDGGLPLSDILIPRTRPSSASQLPLFGEMWGVSPVISAAVEGVTDEAVARRILREVGAQPGTVYGKAGKPELRKRIAAYNNAARHAPWLILVDLNGAPACAPDRCAQWLPEPAPQLCFRVAVRQVEAWLMADSETLAEYLRVSAAAVPDDPEAIPNAKTAMVNLARRSRKRDVQRDMVPRDGSGRSVGPAYTSRLIEYADRHWRPRLAAERADSLRRALSCLERLATRRE